jgi:hypothetical protein
MGKSKVRAILTTVLVLLGSVGQAPAAPLQAGDADQDLDFDQFDLVQVLVAGKYLAGQPATWAEGDWSGAPGGEPGDPPPGDGLFNELDIIAALHTGLYLTGPYNGSGPTSGVSWPDFGILPGGVVGDAQTSIVYDYNTGEIAVDVPAGVQLSSIFIGSAASIFTGPSPDLPDDFDNADANSIFKATFGGSFESLSFGPVTQSGLSEAFLLSDLRVLGTQAQGFVAGGLGDVDLAYVPEPSTVLLLSFGLMALAAGRRRR